MEEEFEDDPHGHITSLGMISNRNSSQTDCYFHENLLQPF